MNTETARLLIGGTGSGCGKTTVSSALLRAWQRRGVRLAAFKCGPDYIDPMFHTAVLGLPSRNLDLFFVDGAACRAGLAQHIPAGGCGGIEGVMGFYDGVSGTTDTASAAHLARETQTPAVLVVSPKGQSLTLAAMLSGLRQFAENTLQGVIFNGISKGMYPFYQAIAEKGGLRAYGYLPRVPAASIPDRHLGLVTAGEIADLQRKLDQLADAAEEGLDLDRLLALAQSAPALTDRALPLAKVVSQPVRIAVARDAVFCFYYEDNLDVLRELGAQIVEFSPLEDGHLPDAIHGLYLGGGYPELYAARLTKNKTLRDELRACITSGLPTVAECGGFMYLHEHIDTSEGVYPMVGVIPGTSRMTGKLQNFGYVTLTAQQDGLLGPKGMQTRAHEFHYATSDDPGCGMEAKKPNGRAWPCVHVRDTLYAGYPHLYFRSNPEMAANFVRKCASMR
ncbi:MAG: cobyrinate a,c-diamide synthase [Butyricicoccus sp.]|nr:cobyrinate a,c-diamide synthase [Butyricicoccus sp.]